MDKIIKIILSILAILLMFLAGWFAHAWKNRGKVTTEVKEAITELNKQHKKVLEALKKDYDKKIEEKNKIIANLEAIIDRLIKFFESTEGPGVEKVIRNLQINKEKLHRL
jgi:hypothetical protein